MIPVSLGPRIREDDGKTICIPLVTCRLIVDFSRFLIYNAEASSEHVSSEHCQRFLPKDYLIKTSFLFCQGNENDTYVHLVLLC